MIEKTDPIYHTRSQNDFETNPNIVPTHRIPESSEKNKSVTAFILDLDGTLFDSLGAWQEIDRQFFREQGMSVPENIVNQINKMSIAEWAKFFTTEYHIPLSANQIIYQIENLACNYYNEKVSPKPHMMEFLNFLDRCGIPYGIATAGYASVAKMILNRYGILNRVKFILTGEDVPSCKKTPEIYLKGCKILESTPETTCVVEDSLHCIQSAKEGGFLTVAVHDSHTSVWEWQEMQKISDLSVKNLLEIIDHFTRG